MGTFLQKWFTSGYHCGEGGSACVCVSHRDCCPSPQLGRKGYPLAPPADSSNDNQHSEHLGRITLSQALRLYVYEPFDAPSPYEASSVINPIVQMQ